MASGKLNHWLQVAANVGIVAGLVLVGIQLKQNSDLLKMQLLYDESRRSIDIETLVVGENGAQAWARSLIDPAGLSLDEQRVLEALLWSYIENLRGTHMLSELGLLRNEEWKLRVESDSAFYLANPYARAWWANYSADVDIPRELIDYINARLAAVDEDFTSRYMADIRAKLPPGSSTMPPKPMTGPDDGGGRGESVLHAARTRYNKALETQALGELDGLFAPGYELISGRGDRVQGAEAHVQMWRTTFADDPTFNCQRTPDEFNVNSQWGLARETGHWLCTQTVGGEPASYAGVYAAKWQATLNSEWVLQSEVFTTLSCNGPPAACRPPDPLQ